jgi:flagellar protein FlbT
MALKVELKPGERIIIGTVVITNGDSRARFFIDGQAPILREKDILTASSADTPAKRIYFCVQLMYLDDTTARQQDNYFLLLNDFLKAAPSTLPIVAELNNRILSGEFYKALKVARTLVAHEEKAIASYLASAENNGQSSTGLR